MAPAASEARKRELRRAHRERPGVRDAERVARARLCQERLLGLPEFATARTLALYWAQGHEVPLEPVVDALRARGVAVVLPRVVGAELALHRVVDTTALVTGRFGLLEPRADAPTVTPHEVDVFVVPGLLFDRAGNRLGRGGGHYDRLLGRARADAYRIGVCYGERLLEQQLPIDEWDIPMCAVATEGELCRILAAEGES